MYRFLIVILLFITSCDGKPDIYETPPTPKNLIEQDKFTDILVDTQILEATLKLKLIRKKDINQRVLSFYDQIFEKHQVTEEAFRASFDFYALQAHKMVEVFDSAEVRLIRLKTELESNNQLLLDSLATDSLSVDTINVVETP